MEIHLVFFCIITLKNVIGFILSCQFLKFKSRVKLSCQNSSLSWVLFE